MDKPIYLDYNATTPIAPEVIDAMKPFLYEEFGNPSSSHYYGVRAKKGVENARINCARLLNCDPTEIIFTSGGTESNNMAIRGVAFTPQKRDTHVFTSAVEHLAVIEVCKYLEQRGFKITVLPVDETGMVDPEDLENKITPEPTLVSIMLANNEVGTIQPVEILSEIAHKNGAIVHTDAAQAVGKIEVDVRKLDVDLLSVAGHKLYAPKGVGMLYVRNGIDLSNLMFGAGHENGHRPGTENVLEIVGLGEACRIAKQDLEKIHSHYLAMRDRLHQKLENNLGPDLLRLNGHLTKRLPNTLSLSFNRIAANHLLEEIDQSIAASAGSACHADQVSISKVLEAMHVPSDWAMGTIRFSVGRGTTEVEVDQAVQIITNAVMQLSS